MKHHWLVHIVRSVAAWAICAMAAQAMAQPVAFDAEIRESIDAFVESQRQACGIPGIALAIVHEGKLVHSRSFGHDGFGHPISADTPFPIGSLTMSFTALLVRQTIDAVQLEADAPVQRRMADTEASVSITLRHLLNQTSGFSRADGIAPLVELSIASVEELARGLGTVSLNRPVGEHFECSNLNLLLLGAVLQAVSGRSWQAQVQAQVFQPLQMMCSYTDHDVGRRAGMTVERRMWFGLPVAQLLAPAAPLRRFKLGAADFEFRYGEGWLVGPYGAASDARWHQGALSPFEAWMLLLPDTKQAVVLLINANSELPFNDGDAVTSRLPLGVVNQLCAPTALRTGAWSRRFIAGSRIAPPT